LTPGFWIGFDESKGSSVTVEQRADDGKVGDAGHKFIVGVEAVDLAGSEWLTIEQVISSSQKFTVDVSVVARTSQPAAVDLMIFIPRKGKPNQRVPLATVQLDKEFRAYDFKKTIDLSGYPDYDET